MAEVFRAPIRVTIPLPRQPLVWQGPNLLASVLARGAVPFIQTDWTNPVLPRAPINNLTWLAEPLLSTLSLANPKPFLLSDWQNPLPQRYPNENIAWTNEQFELLTTANTKPFSGPELSNPILRRRMVVPHHHRETGASPVVTPVTDPFIAKMFPNPVLRRPFWHPQVSRVLDNVIEVDPATLTHEWDNPRGKSRPQMPFVVENPSFYTLAAAQPTPFVQSLWPNPIRRSLNIDPLSWFNDPILTPLSLTNTKPFLLSEWPNPLPKQYAQQRDFIPNFLFTISPPPPKLMVIRKTLATMGTRILSRQRHKAGEA